MSLRTRDLVLDMPSCVLPYDISHQILLILISFGTLLHTFFPMFIAPTALQPSCSSWPDPLVTHHYSIRFSAFWLLSVIWGRKGHKSLLPSTRWPAVITASLRWNPDTQRCLSADRNKHQTTWPVSLARAQLCTLPPEAEGTTSHSKVQFIGPRTELSLSRWTEDPVEF